MKNQLEFSNDSVKIIFTSGAESFYFESKEEALEAVRECRKMGKISEHEFFVFTGEIVSSKLPSSFERSPDILIVMGHCIDTFIEEIVTSILKSKKVNLRFELCNCMKKQKHGYFFTEDGFPISKEINSKAEAYLFIQEIEENGVITPTDANSLKVSIEMIHDFLENPIMN